MNISVCMATYNGTGFLERQINSILKQLRSEDELIIVDDASNDDTLKILRSIKDSRVKVIVNSLNLGVIKTFEKAMKQSTGDIIFLSDQDDEWVYNKVDAVLQSFRLYNADLIQHDALIVNSRGETLWKSWSELRSFGPGIFKNFTKNTYTGCCMAFTRKLLNQALPIPSGVQSHDQWLGLVAELQGLRVVFIKDILLHYVRHNSNVSQMKRRSMQQVLIGRAKLLGALAIHFFLSY